VVEQLSVLAGSLPGELALAVALFALTSALVGAGVPGVIVPLSFSSGALLGSGTGILVVVAGALAGSQALFLVARNLMRERMRVRLGDRLDKFERHFERRGLLYIVGLRVAGAPHLLVTAGSALVRLRSDHFAAATALGFLPAIAVAALAGSAL
jgi:uncharacterized membrane protein YdjX (TVP38/TMEM64 family)